MDISRYKFMKSITIILNHEDINLELRGKRLDNLSAYFEVFVSE